MRGISELRAKEEEGVNVLMNLFEQKKWMWFFQFYLTTFITNIMATLSLVDPELSKILGLGMTRTSTAFMSRISSMCKGFDAASWDGSDHIVMQTFYMVVPHRDREFLLSFSEHLETFIGNHPGITTEMVHNLYALRNYFLLKDELFRLFHEKNTDKKLEDCLPTELLQILGLTPIFSF